MGLGQRSNGNKFSILDKELIMERRFSKVLFWEGVLLTIAGLAHIVYLIWFVRFGSVEPQAYFGGMFFGVVYLIGGLSFLFGKTKLLVPSLIVNALGLTVVLLVREASPLWRIDPYLIVLDIISIPTLIYLNWKAKK